jgi:hypothetical protein
MRSGDQYLADLQSVPTEKDRAWTRHVVRRAIFLPTLALAAARWGDRATRIIDVADATLQRSGYRRGAALIAHARAVRDQNDAALEAAVAEYAALGLAFEEALGLYDLAILRARAAREDVDPLLRRARATAERIGAEALAASLRV